MIAGLTKGERQITLFISAFFALCGLFLAAASRYNALLTLNSAWHKVRDDATLRFMMLAVVFYGLSNT